MAQAKITTRVQGSAPIFTGLWKEDKPGASEGATCNVLDSAYFPLLKREKWVCHNGMWIFVPPDGPLM